MPDEIGKGIYYALLPPGSLWQPKPGGDLEKLIIGMADGEKTIRDLLGSIADFRNPAKTPILSDLEREYGIEPDETEAESIRRARLASAKAGVQNTGRREFLESQLRTAGFDVYVHANEPPVDPAFMIDLYADWIICGDADAYCGADDCVCGDSYVDLIVNGPPDPEYAITSETWSWPLFFMIGGLATRNGLGELTDVALADIALDRYDEFIRTVMKYKPAETWAIIYIRFS